MSAKPLMIVIERVVRPIRASESRKLRMRRELFTHLQAAVEEERATGLDETAAIEKAILRLGNPIELARDLERTVPWPQRLLWASIPVRVLMKYWERRGSHWSFGGGAITLPHIVMLASLAGILTAAPIYTSAQLRQGLTCWKGERPAIAVFICMVIFFMALEIFAYSFRFVVMAADAHKTYPLSATLMRAAAVAAPQFFYVILATDAASNWLPTLGEVALNIAITGGLLVGTYLLARRVAALRRAYDEWLSIDLAE